MKYTIRSHPTRYKGVAFRSRLEARWAAFFDIVGWKWEYEPIDLIGWTPDFSVEFPCLHSECNGSHTLLVEIKPFYCVSEFAEHRCMDFPYGHSAGGEVIPADASAGFGISPQVVYWEMSHGAGGGIEDDLQSWTHVDVTAAWTEAGNRTQYRPKQQLKNDITEMQLLKLITEARKRLGIPDGD